MRAVWMLLLVVLGILGCDAGSVPGLLPADGDQVDGDRTDRDDPDGDKPDGDLVDGDDPDGDLVDGDDPDGDLVDGDDPDGDLVDGDDPDGDLVDGDDPDGDDPDGDEPDGDDPDGDEPDCLVGHYGEDCLPCQCERGICNDGPLGDGSCLCDPGWLGEHCDVAHSCCEAGDTPGCDNSAIEECVCSRDSWCCWSAWDDVCVEKVESLRCGSCSCPKGALMDEESGRCYRNPCEPNPCGSAYRGVCRPQGPAAYECVCDPGFIPEGEACVENPTPEGLGCSDPIPLGVGEHVITGSTQGGQSVAKGRCGGNGPERVYALTFDRAVRISARVSGFDAVVYLRSVCDLRNSEIVCDDDNSSYGNDAYIERELQPGTYFLYVDSYSDAGDYTLTLRANTNPCDENPCSGDPVCQPTSNWSSYNCVCGLGEIPYGDQCLSNPCVPNPCQGNSDYRTRCEPDLPLSHFCRCAIGYIEDELSGDCEPDPNANEWGFFVFLNADNNLESYGWSDLAEMESVGSTAFVHVVVLMDTYQGTAKTYYVRQGSRDVLTDHGELDMGDWRTLADFGVWAMETYPTRRAALVMWNHGDGWEKRSGKRPDPLFKGFSNDDHGSYAGISISNGDYARALAAITQARGEKLDLVGFDACLMGMWEVAEATAPYADVLVASQETEPADGWPYHRFLPALVADPQSVTALDLGRGIVDAYHAESSNNATLSVIDLTTMDALALSLTGFADALMTMSASYARLNTLRQNTQNFYWIDEFRDLRHFARLVRDDGQTPGRVSTAASALIAQLDLTIAYSRAKSSHPNATGLSIFFPSPSGWNANYIGAGAVWSERSTWDDFLRDFTGNR